MLPFEPESLDSLKARYQAAVEPVLEVNVGASPGSKRQHVFDFEFGLRVIVGRLRFPDGVVFVHFTASAQEPLPSWMEVRTQEGFASVALRAFRDLSGDARPEHFKGWSEKGIPHWVIPEGERI